MVKCSTFKWLARWLSVVVKNPSVNAGNKRDMVQSLGPEDPLEEEVVPHSSILAWEILRTEEPGGLQSMGPQRIRLSD